MTEDKLLIPPEQEHNKMGTHFKTISLETKNSIGYSQARQIEKKMTKRQCLRPVEKLASSQELSFIPDITQNKLQGEHWTQTEETFHNVENTHSEITERNVSLKRKYTRIQDTKQDLGKEV